MAEEDSVDDKLKSDDNYVENSLGIRLPVKIAEIARNHPFDMHRIMSYMN